MAYVYLLALQLFFLPESALFGDPAVGADSTWGDK